MSATEPRRLALHAAARAALCPEEGDTLMALTPPTNTDMATMQALDRFEERLGARIVLFEERLGARIDKAMLRLRVSTLVTIIAVQGVSTGFLSITLR